MGALNKVQIIGNLGADPDSRTTQGGMVVTTLRIATNERKKDGDQWVDHTEWHRVVCFGKLAENAARYLQKGRQVYVDGKLRTRKWTDKEGVDRYSTEINADNLVFLGSGSGDGGQRGGGGSDPGGYSGAQPSGGGGFGGGGFGDDADIPFVLSLDCVDPFLPRLGGLWLP
jgi:single-strand DNA-binding protein